MIRVKGAKFQKGDRVYIAKGLDPYMQHFTSGLPAVVDCSS